MSSFDNINSTGGGDVDWITNIQKTIDIIEDNIESELNSEILSKLIFTSSFYYQRIFTILCNCTVGEYIRNRRLTLAGYDILNSKKSIIEIAIKYRYESNESFTRAFTRYHGVTPSVARKTKNNLRTFSPIHVTNNLLGGKAIMNDFSKRGYIVKENGSIYYTQNMDKTIKWFQEVLGWYGQIESRDEEGVGTYGCVDHIPIELQALRIAPFTGMHLFKGEPLKTMMGFIFVDNVEKFHAYVKNKALAQITDIINEPWGGNTCEVTTIDGSILKFWSVG